MGQPFRRFMDAGIAAFARLMTHVFFRDIEVVGLERIPRGVPLVIVANHVNSVVDSMLILGYLGARPRMLAKSTLWSHPVMAPFLLLAGAIPVFRRQEANPIRNLSTFARCGDVLAGGGAIALFPEGTSHDQPRLLPLKTGAARIALEGARRGARVHVLPVGLVYEAKDRFGSRAVVNVGVPLEAEPGAAVKELTARMAAGLGAALTAGIEGRSARRPIGRLEKAVGLVGAVIHWLPYKIPGWVAGRLTRSPNDRATYKLLMGLLAFPIFWVASAVVVGRLGGLAWGVAAAVLTPLTAFAALRCTRFEEERER